MKSLKYWLTISFITFLLLVFIELFIRLCFPSIQPQGCDKDMIQDFVYAKSMGLVANSKGVFFGKVVHSDANRCRKKRQGFDKKKNSWLHIGDSVTMGVGVDDDATFSALLAQDVDSLNILNPSLIGYSVVDYKNVIRKFIMTDGNKLHITKITLFYCMNDIYGQTFMEKPSQRYLFLEFIKAHYRTYIALKGLLFNRPQAIYDYDRKYYQADGKELKQVANEISQIQLLCKLKQIDFNIVVLPYLPQVAQKERPTEEYKILDEALNNNNNNPPPMMDASAAFKLDEDYKKYYLFGDGIHFTTLGHQQIYSYYRQVFFKK